MLFVRYDYVAINERYVVMMTLYLMLFITLMNVKAVALTKFVSLSEAMLLQSLINSTYLSFPNLMALFLQKENKVEDYNGIAIWLAFRKLF